MNDLCLGELTLTVINCEKTEEITKAIQKITTEKAITSEEAIKVARETKATELADFLSLFNKIYCSCLPFKKYLSHIVKYDYPVERLYSNFFREICEYHDKYPECELLINSICYNSPLKINLRGVTYALVMAIIILGGEMKAGMLEFKVNSLAESIKLANDIINEKY